MKRQVKFPAVLVAPLLVCAACGSDDTAVLATDATGGGSAARAGADAATSHAGNGGSSESSGTGARAETAAAGSGAGAGGETAAASGDPVTIRFKAKVGDQDFACGRDYTGLGTGRHTATPQDFRFFVQEVRLLSSTGEEVPLQLDERASVQSKDVALVDFTDQTGLCGGFGNVINTEITGRAPAGTYTGIVFVNGVPESLNHINLTMAKAPLQDPATFWGWLGGYRFVMAEISRKDAPDASADSDAGALADPVTLIHIGSAACARDPMTLDYSCMHPNRSQVRLTGFDPTTHAIVADFAKDMGKFKAPTLRNIALTAPYMHDGSIATLSEVLDHYALGGRHHVNGVTDPLLKPFKITDQERTDIIAFLESLTDNQFITNPQLSDPWPAEPLVTAQ